MTVVNEGDVGGFFLGADGDVWELVSYAPTPSASWERLRDKERRGGCVGSPLASEFKRLIPEERK